MSKKCGFGVLTIFLICFMVTHVHANEPRFLFPVSCTYGKDCWPVNYVDVDPTEGVATDFKCKRKTYDTHQGTDFAIKSVSLIRKGVDVLAAASGKVLRLREGEDDLLKTQKELDEIKAQKKECGNGVLIDHGGDLQTIYCHLKKNSLVVKPKQKVKAGEKIAQVGMSGYAEFPHLHFGVLKDGGFVDPFTGALNTKGCAQMKQAMWLEGLPVSYEEVVIFGGGFRSKSPDFEAIKRGEENPEVISINSAAFVFWAGFYNVEKGDKVTLRITDPEGEIFNERTETIPTIRTQQYYFTGRKIGRVQLKKGLYKAYVKIERENPPVMREETFTVRVE